MRDHTVYEEDPIRYEEEEEFLKRNTIDFVDLSDYDPRNNVS